ncbi:hypothetical protein [Capnocytophaga cynodegmi]|uniref:hypothetical protein n=1 Tax=Capnocytophaga cynodegmi TaxID=28189 RepID=UPI00385FEB13
MIIKKALLGLLFGSFNRSVVGVFVYVESVDFLIFLIPAILIWTIILPKLGRHIENV